jgi:uncharacterized protein
MAETSHFAPGTFCWADLGSPDAKASVRFYTGLFGWTANEVPSGPGQTYVMLQSGGKDACAVYQSQEKGGPPPHWLVYCAVKSADATTKAATAAGGKVLSPPIDVMDAGRMAVLQDPTGAAFAVWEGGKHAGAQHIDAPGGACWWELMTRDSAGAQRFYGKLFGWTFKPHKGGAPDIYTEYSLGPRMLGGFMQMTPKEWGDIPPHWMVYFQVERADATAEKAKALGANLRVPPRDIPDVGRFAVIQDPQGASFSIFQPKA